MAILTASSSLALTACRERSPVILFDCRLTLIRCVSLDHSVGKVPAMSCFYNCDASAVGMRHCHAPGLLWPQLAAET